MHTYRREERHSWSGGGTGKTWETMAIPKTPTNNEHLDLFIMQLRLKNYFIILPSTQCLQLIIFMRFHLVSFAHNIYI